MIPFTLTDNDYFLSTAQDECQTPGKTTTVDVQNEETVLSSNETLGR